MMRSFVYIFAITVQLVVSLELVQQNDDGSYLDWTLEQYFDFEPGNCSGKIQICQTCSSIAICNNGKPLQNVPCPADMPFCKVDGLGSYCDTTPSPGCEGESQSDAINCNGPGYLPDPSDCTKYHYCKGSNTKSKRMSCRSNFVFNATSSSHYCRRSATNTDCTKIQCPTTSGFVLYGTTPNRFYAYCDVKPSEKPEILMFACDKGMVFNIQSLSCVIQCTADRQRKRNPRNAKQYYECYSATHGGALLYDLNNCPDGTCFDETDNICKDGTCPALEMKLEWFLQDQSNGF